MNIRKLYNPVPAKVAFLAVTVVLFVAQPAIAETFDDRWSIIPKANAEPAPQPDVQSSPEPAHEVPDANADRDRSLVSGSVVRPQRKAFSGRASYYAYAGGKTASGAIYNRDAFTAAHRTLPFGTRLLVTDLTTSKAVIVVITDRGPNIRGRVLDLSLGAARSLDMVERGLTHVRAEIL